MHSRNKCAQTTIRRPIHAASQPIRSTNATSGYMIYKNLHAKSALSAVDERQLEHLYARYAEDVDQIEAIVALAKAAHHRKVRGQRVRTAQQDQVVVRWKPTLMQGWVADIAQDLLKHRIVTAREATMEEIMNETLNTVVECCTKLPEPRRPNLEDTTAIACDTCHTTGPTT